MDAVVDRFVVDRKHEKAIKAAIAATLLVGDGLMQVQIVKGATRRTPTRFYKALTQRDAPLRLRRHRARTTSCSTTRRARAARAADSACTS